MYRMLMKILRKTSIGKRVSPIASTAISVILARGASFALFVISARHMSTTDYASLVYAIGVSQILVQIGSLGWLNLIRREATRFDVTASDLARGFILRSFQIPILGVALSCVLFYLPSHLESFDQHLSQSVRYSVMLAIPSLFSSILREYLASLKRPAASVLCNETIPMMVTVAFVLLLGIQSVDACVWLLIAVQTACLAPQALMLYPAYARFFASADIAYKSLDWTKAAFLTVLGYGGKLLMDRMDTLMIAPMAGMEALAQFNSINRIASLQLIVPVILIPVFSPLISDAFAKRDVLRLRSEIFLQIGIILVTSVPFSLVLFLFPNYVMSAIFGAKFAGSSDILWLSVTSNLLFSFALPFGVLLLMTDGEKPYATGSLCGLTVYALGVYELIPTYGIHGAAWAMLAGTMVLTLLIVFAGRRRLALAQEVGKSHEP